MFTRLQKNRIKYLIQNTKYGKILEKAVIQWEKDVKIGYRDFGIIAIKDKWNARKKCACLIGASLISDKIHDSNRIAVDASIRYGIPVNDIWTIANAFDGDAYVLKTNREAHRFGREIYLLLNKRRAIKQNK